MEQDFSNARKFMAARQLRLRGISNRRVLEAFESIPRHLFVPEEHLDLAYDDRPLPIGFGQTISQPYIVAYMIQSLDLTGRERALEVGAGCGYAAAVLSGLVAELHAIELIPALADRALKNLAQLEINNVSIHVGDGSLGWIESAPYDAILVSAAAPRVPQPLLNQLADHGRMILPVGISGIQELELWQRRRESFSHKTLLPVSFVPLRSGDDV